jgi:aspartate racemase
LAAVGVEECIPDEAGQAIVQRVIFEELVPNGSVSRDSLQQLLQVVADLRAAGCDGVALACTELPLVLDEANCGMAAVDTTAVLARAAMQRFWLEACRTGACCRPAGFAVGLRRVKGGLVLAFAL